MLTIFGISKQNDDAVENIKAALEKSCEICPDIDGCQQFIDQNIDGIVKSLREIITVDNICETLRLCGARVSAPVKPKANVKSCGLCSEVVDYLIGELKVRLIIPENLAMSSM